MTPASMASYREALIPAYIDYCQTVSKRSMAIALETATYLWFLCVHLRATRVCDLGSGFSSYTLRCYAQRSRHPVTVVSVDDSDHWLNETATFLAKWGHEPAGLVAWGDWDGEYDVILHDFARGDLRNESMWTAAGRLAPGGQILFDDAQHRGHRAEMAAVAARHGFTVTDLPVTRDQVGRFAAVAA